MFAELLLASAVAGDSTAATASASRASWLCGDEGETLAVLELGCGSGLASIAAAMTGARVLATDAVADAAQVVAQSARLNGVGTKPNHRHQYSQSTTHREPPELSAHACHHRSRSILALRTGSGQRPCRPSAATCSSARTPSSSAATPARPVVIAVVAA
jgi:hypothetical protein